MNRPLLLLAGAGALAVAAFALPSPTQALPPSGDIGPHFEPSEDEVAVRKLRQQIAAQELVAALDLSQEQRAELASVLTEVRSQRDEAQETAREQHAVRASALRPILQTYQKELSSKGEVSEDTFARLEEFRREFRPDRRERRERRGEAREAIASVLTEAQAETLRNFRPLSRPRGAEMEETDRHSDRSGRSGSRRGESRADDRERQQFDNPRQRGSHGKRGKMGRLLLSDDFLEVLSGS